MKITKIENPKWQKDRPTEACVFATYGELFTIWQFVWMCDGEGFPNYYLSWCDRDGDEWDDLAECKFDE